jgi:hypothetical protein
LESRTKSGNVAVEDFQLANIDAKKEVVSLDL